MRIISTIQKNKYSFQGLFVAFFIFLQITLLLFSNLLYAQSWAMPVDGKVYAKGNKLGGAIITLFKGSQQIQQVVTTSNGRFSFELIPNAEYIIAITKPGYITKKFKIITTNVPPDRADASGFNPFEPDVTLFEMPTAPEISKRIEAILSQPIAIYQYIPNENNFNYDEKYTEAIQNKLSELAQLQKQAESTMQENANNSAMEAQKQLEIDKEYKEIIARADASFNAKDYPSAKIGFSQALTIKQGETYPHAKIAEINKIVSNSIKQAENEAKYNTIIKKGDAALNSKDYSNAKSLFTEAISIKPNETYPKTKLDEIDILIAEAGKKNELDSKYNAAINKGLAALSAKDYITAKAAYAEAKEIKPSEAFPKAKIIEIDKLLSDIASQKSTEAKDQQYKDILSKADTYFSSKNYALSKLTYNEALNLKPNDSYPKAKIMEIDKILSESLNASNQKEIDIKYNTTLGMADAAFEKKDYSLAKNSYLKASEIKPTELYPKSKLDEISKLLAIATNATTENENETKYKATIAKADKSFNLKDYSTAKPQYSEALKLKPLEQYPKDRIVEIEKIEKSIKDALAQKENTQYYNEIIAIADSFFSKKEYVFAKLKYQEASDYKPTEKYPQDKILQINNILNKSNTVKNKNEKKDGSVSRPIVSEEDKTKDYQSELRTKYPNGTTEEEYTENGKTVLRRIVIKADFAGVYTKVTHNWGGVYCFKDNAPISEVAFENESK
jgi:tetratricopeptide (TPR) repeat protein